MNILIDDIPVNLQRMVDIIGIDKLIELSKVYGGASIYIPMHKTLRIRERKRKIAKEFNGVNGESHKKCYIFFL
ncbi:transcriptional regulator [Terrisporobacter petrolearius]|uniref:Mor transcription activator family protein n=1 Tax=Terrisporobacter petrolearius TaxID=1460447 RepID=UPI001D1625F3|nr:Mor transcription activator family protein [Terrisporobacter petrolearius]MCC3863458.1 transcriptional regulator [Terrisporobacter petrolearius]